MTLRCIHRHTKESHPNCFTEGSYLVDSRRNREEWSEGDDKILLMMVKEKYTYHEIAVQLGRTYESVRSRYRRLEKVQHEDKNVLVFDIETSLMVFTGWRTGKTYLGPTNILQDYHIISWAAKWLYEDEVFSGVLSPDEARRGDDKRILKPLWKLLDKADVIVGHNINRFDTKKLNTRFLINGMQLPIPAKPIDTLTLARRVFHFSSNKLDYICQVLGLPAKSEHSGYDLWLRCLKGDKSALKEMVEYNENDVVITEDVYHILKEGLHGGVRPPLKRYGGWKNG